MTSIEPSVAARAGAARRQAWLVAGASAAIALSVLVLSGVGFTSSLLLTLILAVQTFAGAVVWWHLDRRAGAVMVLGMGLAIGTAVAVLSGLLVQLAGLGTRGWALPGVAAIVVVIVRRLRPREAGTAGEREPLDRPTVVALAVSSVLGLGTLAYNLLNYPLSWNGAISSYHTDMPFFEALATSIARLGPLDSVFLPGAEIRYHWLAYGWAGQVTQAGGAEPFAVLTRVLPMVALVASACIVVAWARRLSSVSWVPPLAAALLLVGGYVGATYGGVLSNDSPSQSLSVVWLIALSLAVLHLLGAVPTRARAWLLVLIAVLGFSAMGGKVSTGVPAMGAVAVVALMGLARREQWRWWGVGAAVTAWIAGALAFVLLISGSAGGGGLVLGSFIDKSSSQQGLNPMEGAIGVAAGTVILLLAIAARWAGLAWLGLDRMHRWSPVTVYGFGLAAVSLLAVAVFNSFNEIWFSAAASGPLAAITAWGAGEAADRLVPGDCRHRDRLALLALLIAAVGYVVVWFLWATGASGGNVWVSTLRWMGPVAAGMLAIAGGWLIAQRAGRGRSLLSVLAGMTLVLVFISVPGRLLGIGTGQVGAQQNGLRNEWFSVGRDQLVGLDRAVLTEWTSDQMSAGAWVREHADQSDLLATNLTFGPFVPAVTGLQTYVSGLLYQSAYGRPSISNQLLAHEADSWDFIDTPSADSVEKLCAAGVRWVWVDPSRTERREWTPFATVAYKNVDAIILRLEPGGC